MGVVSMLREGTASGDFHPAVKLTAMHCSRLMEKGSTETSALHLLGMLKDCLANLKTTVSSCINHNICEDFDMRSGKNRKCSG